MEKNSLQVSALLQRFKVTDREKILSALNLIADAQENESDVKIEININGSKHFKVNATRFNIGAKTR